MNRRRLILSLILGGLFSATSAFGSQVAYIYRAENGVSEGDELMIQYISEAFGDTVTSISDAVAHANRTDQSFWDAYDLAYWNDECLGGRDMAPIAIPVIISSYFHVTNYGFGSSSGNARSVPDRRLIKSGESHWITDRLVNPTDTVMPVFGANVYFSYAENLGQGVQNLLHLPGSPSQAVLAVVDSGATLDDGEPAPNRRALIGFADFESGGSNPLSLRTWGDGNEIFDRTYYWALNKTDVAHVRNYTRIQNSYLWTQTWLELGSCDSAIQGNNPLDLTWRPGYDVSSGTSNIHYGALGRVDLIREIIGEPPQDSTVRIDSVRLTAHNANQYNIDGGDDSFDFWGYVAKIIHPVRWSGNPLFQGGDSSYYDPHGGASDCDECGEFACGTNHGTNRYWASHPVDVSNTDSAWHVVACRGIGTDIADYGADTIRFNKNTVPLSTDLYRLNAPVVLPLRAQWVQDWWDDPASNNGFSIGEHRIIDSSSIEINFFNNGAQSVDQNNNGAYLEIWWTYVPVSPPIDLCPEDPDKTEPGICGCGIPDIDSDSDGVADCNDICAGGDDTQDYDNDGVPNYCDKCPSFDDSIDADSDGIPDQCDFCPNQPGNCTCCDLAGDVDGNGQVGVPDITMLFGKIFDQSMPECADRADCDGNGRINVGDATRLMAFLYASGPPPLCGHFGM